MGLVVTSSLRFPEPPAQGALEGALWGFASWPHCSGDHTPLTDSHAHLRVLGSQSTQQPGAAPTSLASHKPSVPYQLRPIFLEIPVLPRRLWSYSTQRKRPFF